MKSFPFILLIQWGKIFSPSPSELPLVNHQENEGLFRFGRPLEDDELVTHTEKTVLDNFQDAVANFHDINLEQERAIVWAKYHQEWQQRRNKLQQLKNMEISLPHGISLKDLVDEIIALYPSRSVKKIAKAVRKKIIEIAIYPDVRAGISRF